MRFYVVTLFPEFFESPLKSSLLGKAVATGTVSIKFINPRDFAEGKYRKVDDTPYGGGAGMVMMAEPIALAVESIRAEEPDTYVALLAARGKLFDQAAVRRYAANYRSLTLICGHYEGVDERVAEHIADESVRLGNFVLSGGEPAALTIIDAVARRMPGFMGNDESLDRESFDADPAAPDSAGQLAFEHAQYTRPENWRGHKVPEVLLSGNHAKIEEWRKENAARTRFE